MTAAAGLRFEMRLLDGKMRDNPELHPGRATDGAAAFDLRGCFDEPLCIEAGEVEVVGTGVAVHIKDPGGCGMLAPRSSLGLKGIVLANLVGIIDSDYTGEIKVGLWNRSGEPQTLQPYERLCQLLFLPVMLPSFEHVEKFSEPSARGAGGFGSTGRA